MKIFYKPSSRFTVSPKFKQHQPPRWKYHSCLKQWCFLCCLHNTAHVYTVDHQIVPWSRFTLPSSLTPAVSHAPQFSLLCRTWRSFPSTPYSLYALTLTLCFKMPSDPPKVPLIMTSEFLKPQNWIQSLLSKPLPPSPLGPSTLYIPIKISLPLFCHYLLA